MCVYIYTQYRHKCTYIRILLLYSMYVFIQDGYDCIHINMYLCRVSKTKIGHG